MSRDQTLNKRSIFVFCFLFMAVFCSSVLGQSNLDALRQITKEDMYVKGKGDFDGNDWLGWTPSNRLYYLVGFVKGANYVSVNNFDSIVTEEMDGAGYKSTIHKNEVLRHYGMGGFTVRQLIDGMDGFYQDFRNRNIKTQAAAYLVLKQINGAPEEGVKALIAFFRKPDAEPDVQFDLRTGEITVPYIDSSGKKQAIKFP
jgi:hypothetical protein